MATELDIPQGVSYYCYSEGVDMRKGINSLFLLIKNNTTLSPSNGDAFIFIASTRKSVKILRWHNEGFILYHKKLEVGMFILPQISNDNPFFSITEEIFNKFLAVIKHRSRPSELKQLVFSRL